MNNYEIYESYVNAANQQKQISILADLNCCDEDAIIKIIKSYSDPMLPEDKKSSDRSNEKMRFSYKEYKEHILEMLKSGSDYRSIHNWLCDFIHESGSYDVPSYFSVRQFCTNLKRELGLDPSLGLKSKMGAKKQEVKPEVKKDTGWRTLSPEEVAEIKREKEQREFFRVHHVMGSKINTNYATRDYSTNRREINTMAKNNFDYSTIDGEIRKLITMGLTNRDIYDRFIANGTEGLPKAPSFYNHCKLIRNRVFEEAEAAEAAQVNGDNSTVDTAKEENSDSLKDDFSGKLDYSDVDGALAELKLSLLKHRATVDALTIHLTAETQICRALELSIRDISRATTDSTVQEDDQDEY